MKKIHWQKVQPLTTLQTQCVVSLSPPVSQKLIKHPCSFHTSLSISM